MDRRKRGLDMAVKVKKNGEVVFPVNSNLNGSTASSIGLYLDYLIKEGTKKIILDFTRVRNFEYFGMAVLMDFILQCKKDRGVEIGLHGLSGECLTAARYLGFEKISKLRG